MLSSEVMGARSSAFSFTLHSCFIGITDWMLLKCSSLSFSTSSSFIFYTLIHWILLLWLGVRPGGHQRGARAVLGMVVLDAPFCPAPDETGWSSLGNWTVRFGGCRELVPTSSLLSVFAFGTLFYSATTSSRPFFVSGFTSPLVKDSLLSPIFS
jgi:hypothetical protein